MPRPAPIKSPVNKNAISTVKPADIIEVQTKYFIF